ncbi:MAG: methylenetetrahydrofolate reductase [Myxococcota bacterium]|nr:methylenetetrahydrofolate reductase [Myxococcota bacterium]
MTGISLELVPRSPEAVAAELRLVAEAFPHVDTVNIPDLLRFPLRSWEACRLAKQFVTRAIPHLRAMDFAADAAFPLTDFLRGAEIDSVLVVSGDPPQDMTHRVFPTGPVELIRRLKAEAPGLRVYAGFDPYRSGAQDELEYARAKLDAGADGFFSQPFFDLRLIEVWAELLAGREVWWGVSPVLSARTRRYWETKNRAFFPASFTPTWDWNRAFAAAALQWVRDTGANLYFMPIRADLRRYLEGIL